MLQPLLCTAILYSLLPASFRVLIQNPQQPSASWFPLSFVAKGKHLDDVYNMIDLHASVIVKNAALAECMHVLNITGYDGRKSQQHALMHSVYPAV